MLFRSQWVGWIWALSWAIAGIAAITHDFLAGVLISLSQVIFAVGEMIWSPTSPSLTNDLAPDALRGRYNAIMGIQWNVAGVIGPAMVGILLGNRLSNLWIVLMIVGSLGPTFIFRSIGTSREN